jgi:hypothetical protein
VKYTRGKIENYIKIPGLLIFWKTIKKPKVSKEDLGAGTKPIISHQRGDPHRKHSGSAFFQSHSDEPGFTILQWPG